MMRLTQQIAMLDRGDGKVCSADLLLLAPKLINAVGFIMQLADSLEELGGTLRTEEAASYIREAIDFESNNKGK